MSPDGKWIWDGAQWRPIPVHEAAFPNWQGVGAGFVPEVDSRATVAVVPPPTRQESPPASYRMAGPAPGLAVPRWNADAARQQLQRFAPLAIGAAGLIVVIVVVSVVATLVLSNRPSDVPSANVAAPKGGPAARSENAEAAYLVKSLDGPMSDLKDNLVTAEQSCTVGMTSSCEDSIITIANNVAPMLSTLSKSNVPSCIASKASVFHQDLAGVSDSQDYVVKGFNDNKKSEFSTGVADVLWYGHHAVADYAVVRAATGVCDGEITGP